MNSCRTIKIEPPDFGEAVYINEKTVEVQTDHSHPLNCQVWCPSCCTSDVAIPEYPDMEVPIMKTVATQTDHTHSEGWIVQCTLCSSSIVPNAPAQDDQDWCIKLETPLHNELPQCQGSTRTLTNGIDSRVQDVCVETSPPYTESVQQSFDLAVYRMERPDTEMRMRNIGLGSGGPLKRHFSHDHNMARSVEVSQNAEVSRNFIIPGNVVTAHNANMLRGIPVSRMDDMSCGFNVSRNGDILHVNETSSNFDVSGDAELPRRVVLPPNVVEVNALGYAVERRPPQNKTIPVSGMFNQVMENAHLQANHQDVSYDNTLDSLQNGVEEEKATKKTRRGPKKGAKKAKSMKASKGTNASEAQKRNWKNVYQCPYCDMSFGWLSHITRHVRSHTGEKPFKCSHCSKRFARTDELQLHLRVHTGERPYECQYCGKKFTQSANLTVHIRIHTGKKPYKCEICKKRFVHSGDYRRHLRVHTREKPYECCYCFKAFADSSDLKVHIRIHTGEMPYQCPLCFKRFRTSGNLNVHVRGGSCQKTKESLKGKKISQLKKTSAPLPVMALTPVPMMTESPVVVQPAEGLSSLQETQ